MSQKKATVWKFGDNIDTDMRVELRNDIELSLGESTILKVTIYGGFR